MIVSVKGRRRIRSIPGVLTGFNGQQSSSRTDNVISPERVELMVLEVSSNSFHVMKDVDLYKGHCDIKVGKSVNYYEGLNLRE